MIPAPHSPDRNARVIPHDTITSAGNPRVREAARLRDSDARRDLAGVSRLVGVEAAVFVLGDDRGGQIPDLAFGLDLLQTLEVGKRVIER